MAQKLTLSDWNEDSPSHKVICTREGLQLSGDRTSNLLQCQVQQLTRRERHYCATQWHKHIHDNMINIDKGRAINTEAIFLSAIVSVCMHPPRLDSICAGICLWQILGLHTVPMQPCCSLLPLKQSTCREKERERYNNTHSLIWQFDFAGFTPSS